ncbi:MAG TPA: 3-hydroxyacyl-CoA dehydrogenase family protein [Chloroflexota bacterium]|nr:3-hydroxyacyl-CoA dehydrogenase family protein [Chloroflexota bacterium]
MTATIARIAVIGAGLMGGGIAAVSLAGGFTVTAYDLDTAMLDRATQRARKAAGEEAIARWRATTDLAEAVRDADLVIEAVPERLALKREVFAMIDRYAPAHAVLATNTSELSVTAIATACDNPARIAGMHWFNPPERMRLVEIVRGVRSSEESIEAINAVALRLGKETVVVKDTQGFVTSRAVAALIIECIRMLEEGVAGAEDIDKAIRLGLNHPMGPIELADYVGLDTMVLVGEGLREAFGERFNPPQTVRKLVEAGFLGRKSGRGFYSYDERR